MTRRPSIFLFSLVRKIKIGDAMTVDEAIKELQELQEKGYGSAVLRIYIETSKEVYPPCDFNLHNNKKDDYHKIYAKNGPWVEVS